VSFPDVPVLLRRLAGRAKEAGRSLRVRLSGWPRSAASRLGIGAAERPVVPPGPEAPPSSEPITAAQLSFLASLTGLAIAVADAGGRIRLAGVQALKDFFRRSFPYSEEDQRLLSRLVDQTVPARERLGVDELARHFVSVSSPAGRRLLVRLLLKMACGERPRVPPAQGWLIRRIAGTLGLDPVEYDALAAEYLPQSGWEYRLLGLEPGASEAEVRSAYRRLASVSHPDRFTSLGGETVREAEEKFKLLQEAYEEIRRGRGAHA
jgi:DnaJ like chaperone protein